MNSKTTLSRFMTGYTLIELMVVVAIVGIISSIAYSAFTGYTKEADRAQAQSDLLEMAQAMERGFTQNRVYDLTTVDASFFNDRNPRYTISLLVPTTTTYTVAAVTNPSSRDKYDLQLNQLGREQYRLSTGGPWVTGWDNIPD